MIKKNIVLILSFSVLLFILCFYSVDFIKTKKAIELSNEKSLQFCLNIDYKNTEYEDYCNNVIIHKNVKMDFFTVFTNVMVFGLGKYSFILFLFVSIPTLYVLCKYLKNRIILNEVTRAKYSEIKKSLFYDSYKSVFILPFIVILGFIICYFVAGNIDYNYSVLNSTAGWNDKSMSNFWFFAIAYVVNVIFHSIIFVNISMCIARGNHNFFVAVILSFLAYIGVEAILEIGINGILFTTLFKSNDGIIFNIMNMLAFNDECGILAILLVSATIMIISSVIVYIVYKDKEKLIIDCEKG